MVENQVKDMPRSARQNQYESSTCVIRGVGTSVPQNYILQEDFLTRMLQRSWSAKESRYLSRLLADSGIEKRHVVLSLDGTGSIEYKGLPFEKATTSARNKVFAVEVVPLVLEAAREACKESKIDPSEITHVIAASCTGFTNPGFDHELIKALNLSKNVHRYFLGFMGCYAAFPALELADSICLSDTSAVVLCVCAEICSLHFQPEAGFDALLAASLFADGAAAVIVSGGDFSGQKLGIVDYHSCVMPDSEDQMAWSIGDEGFNLLLSPYVSRIIGSNIEEFLPSKWLGEQQSELAVKKPKEWVVHPGGKSILDRVESSLGFTRDTLSTSRQILNKYGNMSSATVIFVLQLLLSNQKKATSLNSNVANFSSGDTLCMMGFGPGLTVKSMLLQLQ
jgi:predicted naringenin-chalcone synthase